MITTKCQGQHDRMGRLVISCFSQHLLFRFIVSLFRFIVSLFHSASHYFVLFRSVSIYFALFRQSLVSQKGTHGIHISTYREVFPVALSMKFLAMVKVLAYVLFKAS